MRNCVDLAALDFLKDMIRVCQLTALGDVDGRARSELMSFEQCTLQSRNVTERILV